MSEARRPERRTEPGVAAGIIDTIADAITFVIQRPWLLVVPLVIDLILWLFLKVTMGPVIDSLIRLMETSGVEGSDLVVDQLEAVGDQIMISDYLGAFVPGLLTGMSLDTVMGILMLFVAPEGFGVPREALYAPWQNGILDSVDPGSASVIPLVLAGVLFLSSIALVLFRIPMVRAIRGTTPTGLGQEMFKAWLNFIVYLLMLLAGAILAMVPLALLGVLIPLMGLGVAFVSSLALLIFGGMAGVYTLFVVDAMFVHRTSPINGFRMSHAVSKAYFGQTMRFALTCIFIILATLQLWSQIADTALGLIVSLVGSAFVGTVLTAASLFFYTDRFRLVRAEKATTRNIATRR